jgi:hypothetical protein
MDIGKAGVEKKPRQAGKDRITYIAVRPAHRALLHLSFKTRAHHKIVSLLQTLDKFGNIVKIVSIIAVGHNYKLAPTLL